jgi:hypothetical protein
MFLVLFAYIMGAFPGMEDTTERTTADRLLVDSFSHTRLNVCFTRIKHGKDGGDRDGDGEKQSSRAKKWKICFEKFLMSLADQQLVMSLAIPVAVFTRWSKTSLFSLDMALMLVFTSLVTHLATIRYCPGYLLEHPVMSIARIVAIGAVIGCNIAIGGTRGATVYAAQKYYAATHNITENPSTPFTWAVLPACFLRQNPGLPPDFGYDILWGMTLVLYFANLLNKLFSRKLQSTSFLYRFIMIYVLRQEEEKLGIFNDFARLYDKRQVWISRIESHIPQRIKPVLEYLVAFEAAYFAMTASVLDDIPWLLLVLTYCITKSITTWLATGSPFWESGMSNQGFGLGQITALILLLIPILTLCDTIAEQFDKDIAKYWHCLWSWCHCALRQQASREDLEMGPISAKQNRVETAQNLSPDERPLLPGNATGLSGGENGISPPTAESELEPAKGATCSSTPETIVPEGNQIHESKIAGREEEFQKFSKIRAFRVSIIILSLWSFISFILVAVITAVPWYVFAWNLGATVPFATLFVWEILFEVCHVCYTFALKISGWIAATYNFWRYLVDIAYPSLSKLRKRTDGAASLGTDFA